MGTPATITDEKPGAPLPARTRVAGPRTGRQHTFTTVYRQHVNLVKRRIAGVRAELLTIVHTSWLRRREQAWPWIVLPILLAAVVVPH